MVYPYDTRVSIHYIRQHNTHRKSIEDRDYYVMETEYHRRLALCRRPGSWQKRYFRLDVGFFHSSSLLLLRFSSKKGKPSSVKNSIRGFFRVVVLRTPHKWTYMLEIELTKLISIDEVYRVINNRSDESATHPAHCEIVRGWFVYSYVCVSYRNDDEKTPSPEYRLHFYISKVRFTLTMLVLCLCLCVNAIRIDIGENHVMSKQQRSRKKEPLEW